MLNILTRIKTKLEPVYSIDFMNESKQYNQMIMPVVRNKLDSSV